MADYDVVVVGAGNAALAASVSAREAGAARAETHAAWQQRLEVCDAARLRQGAR